LTTGPLAGRTGQIYADLAQAEGIENNWYWLSSGETRTCLLINHQTSDATVINEPGPPVSETDWQGFARHVQKLAQPVGAVTFAGSLPPGLEAGALATLARSLVRSDRAVYLDTSGPPLAAALARPEGLAIKVNRTELAAGLDRELNDTAQLIEAGRVLLARGADLLVITLGAEGAVAITPTECWRGTPLPLAVVSTVGSGDSFLAGLAVARLRGENIEQALRQAVACGAANALTALPGRVDLATVETLLPQISLTRIGTPT
jgi:1-phosphofructokinase family hexose kinase